MTLDFRKLVTNSVRKQMKIQHFDANVEMFKKEELPEAVTRKIAQAFGESFLQDADYTLWISGEGLTKDVVRDTVFNVVNDGLQRSANDMSESDIKLLDLVGETSTSASLDQAEIAGEPTGADEANGAAIASALGADASSAPLSESVAAPAAGEKFCFLKITMK